MNHLASVMKMSVDVLNRWVEIFCGLLLIGMLQLIVLHVVCRYAISAPIRWLEEIVLLLLVWFAMLSVALGVHRHTHIYIDTLWKLLPARWQYWVDVGGQLLILFFALVIAFNAFDLIVLVYEQVLPASGLPRFFLYVAPIVGGGVMAVNAITNILLDSFIAPDIKSRSEA